MNISPIYTTAPNPTGRSVRENEAFALLDSLGIKYERVEHEAAMTIDACADIDRTLDTPLCKNLFLANSAKTDWFLLLLPGEKPFRTRVVADQIGSTRPVSYTHLDVYKRQEYRILSDSRASVCRRR